MSVEKRIRICGVEHSLGDMEESKWPVNSLNWYVENNMPGVVRDVFRSEIAAALASWSAVADLSFTEVTSSQGAHILMRAWRLDGPGKVLAQSELPPANPCHQDFDFENWSTDGTPASGQIELRNVVCHEVGHALGLLHDDQNADALMAPYYSASVAKPRPRDITRIQALYGPPKSVPTPVPTPTPTPVPTPIPTPVPVPGVSIILSRDIQAGETVRFLSAKPKGVYRLVVEAAMNSVMEVD